MNHKCTAMFFFRRLWIFIETFCELREVLRRILVYSYQYVPCSIMVKCHAKRISRNRTDSAGNVTPIYRYLSKYMYHKRMDLHFMHEFDRMTDTSTNASSGLLIQMRSDSLSMLLTRGCCF